MRLFSASLIIFMSRIVGAGLLFCVYSSVSKYGGVESVAKLALTLSIFTITGTISKFGLDQLGLREIQKCSGVRRNGLAFSLIACSTFLGLVCCFGSYVIWRDLVLALGVLCFSIYSILPEIYRANGSAFKYSLLRNLAFNAILCGFVIFHLLGGDFYNVSSIPMCAALFATLVSLRYLLVVYNIEGLMLVRAKSCLMLLRAGIPIALFQILIVLHSYGYNLVLDAIGSKKDLAIFAIFLQMVLVFGMFSTSIGMQIGRDLAIAVAEKDFSTVGKLYYQSCIISFVVLFPVLLVLMIFSRNILVHLFGLSLDQDLNAFYIMAFGAFLNGVSGPKYTVITMLGKEKIILITSFVLSLFIFGAILFNGFFVDKLIFVSFLYLFFYSCLAVSMALYAISLIKTNSSVA